MRSSLVILLTCIAMVEANAQVWTQLVSGTNNDLKAVHFPTTLVGYAVGVDGTILKTADGGDTWQPTLFDHPGYWFWDVHFTSADTGYVCGESEPGMNPSGAGIVLKTVNGGTSWTSCIAGLAYPLRDLFVLDQDTVIACGSAQGVVGFIQRTVDGGSTWLGIGQAYLDASLGGMYFHNSEFGFLGLYEGSSGFFVPLHSSWLGYYSGTTFSSQSSPSAYLNFAADFGDASTGYMIRATSVPNMNVYLRKTVNGGVGWTEAPIPGSSSGPTGIGLDFLDANVGYFAGADGSILKTLNGGGVWSPMVTPVVTDLRSVYFVNSTLGFAAGDAGTILRLANTAGIGMISDEVPEPPVYPNPGTDHFTLSLPPVAHSIDVFDALGRCVLARRTNEVRPSLDTRALAPGIFLVSVRNERGERSLVRWVKQ